MTELQAYYSRIANQTYTRAQYLAACANPAIDDAAIQSDIIRKCGILTSSAQRPSDLSGCLLDGDGNSIASETSVYKDILCSRHESVRTQTNENDQRTRDLDDLLWMEREKVAFRVMVIVGLLIGSQYI